MVGCSVALLLRRFPGVEVTLVDVDPARADVARGIGVGFARPDDRDDLPLADCDLVVHASATSAGLQTSLDLLRAEGTVIELSWYGDTTVQLSLGGSFHSGRLGIRASQVGSVAPARRGRYTYSQRLALAIDLLHDPAFDALITGRSPSTTSPRSSPASRTGAGPASATPSPTQPPRDHRDSGVEPCSA